MALDVDRESFLQVDERRSLMVTPTEDGKTLVLTVEDPGTVAVVELTMAEVDWLVTTLVGVLNA